MFVGIVGCGRIGSVHARTAGRHRFVDRIAVVDAVAEAASGLASQLGAEVYADLDALLAAEPDAVIVAAPTPAHAPAIRACVAAGVPVFCEKPVAVDLAEAAELVAEVERLDAFVQIGFQRRFDAGVRALQQAVADGAIGTPYLVRLGTHDADPPPPTYVEGPEGIYTETLIHDFDVLRFVTGQEVSAIAALGGETAREATGLEVPVGHTALIAQLDGGAQATLSAARHNPGGYDARVEVIGSTGSACAGYDDGFALRPVGDGTGVNVRRRHDGFVERFRQAYEDEIVAFLDLVAAGADATQSPCTVQDGMAALQIAWAAWESRRSGTLVEPASVGLVPA